MIKFPPFPALTTEQRWHLDVFGYVVIENMLTDDIIYNCSILASTFSATLELAKNGNIELKQKEAFGKIMIRTKNL